MLNNKTPSEWKLREEKVSERKDKIHLTFSYILFLLYSFLFLNPLRSHGRGGMIFDPLRSGYPRSGFDPSSGIPDILPPGAVPPGARFDPFGTIGQRRPG